MKSYKKRNQLDVIYIYIYINHSIDCIEKIAPIAKINSWSLYVFNYKQR
jgi:hypothetical protein